MITHDTELPFSSIQTLLKTIESVEGTEMVEIRTTTPKIHSNDTPAIGITNIALRVPVMQFDDLSTHLKVAASSLNVSLEIDQRSVPPRRISDQYLVVASGAIATNVALVVQTVVTALQNHTGCDSLFLLHIHDDQLSVAERAAGRDGPYHITKFVIEVPKDFPLDRLALRAQIIQSLNRARLNGIAVAIVPTGLTLRTKKLFTIIHHDEEELHCVLKKLGKVAGEKYDTDVLLQDDAASSDSVFIRNCAQKMKGCSTSSLLEYLDTALCRFISNELILFNKLVRKLGHKVAIVTNTLVPDSSWLMEKAQADHVEGYVFEQDTDGNFTGAIHEPPQFSPMKHLQSIMNAENVTLKDVVVIHMKELSNVVMEELAGALLHVDVVGSDARDDWVRNSANYLPINNLNDAACLLGYPLRHVEPVLLCEHEDMDASFNQLALKLKSHDSATQLQSIIDTFACFRGVPIDGIHSLRNMGETAVVIAALTPLPHSSALPEFEFYTENGLLKPSPFSKHVVTIVAPQITFQHIEQVASILVAHAPDASILQLYQLSSRFHTPKPSSLDAQRLIPLDCVDMLVRLPRVTNDDIPDLRQALAKAGASLKIDVSIQRDELVREAKRLAVFDMDSTLIQLECIDEMAAIAGVGQQVMAITSRAMNGELDFEQSLRCRVALLRGLDAEPLFQKIRSTLIYTPGAHFMARVLKKLGFTLAVVSGGFTSIICEVKNSLGLDAAHANVLDIDCEDNKLTGLLAAGTSIIDSRAKARTLRDMSHSLDLEPESVIAVGDGANDLLMLKEAGVGIAFNAKPVVQEQASFRINVVDLTPVLFHLGISREDAVDLIGTAAL